MTKEEELQALREENRTLKALVAELLPLKEQLAQANARIKDLEDTLAKDSRTSSKPPSSDGLARLPRSSRRPSGKRPGGQAGHPGHTLSLVEQPDEVVRHRPKVCSQCNEDLSTVAGLVAERRQVLDLPAIRLLAYEHQIEAICCPTWPGMPREAGRPWTRSASGRALPGEACTTALRATMAMTVRTASVEPTSCAIVRQWPSRSIKSGPPRCRTSCLICMTPVKSGV